MHPSPPLEEEEEEEEKELGFCTKLTHNFLYVIVTKRVD